MKALALVFAALILSSAAVRANTPAPPQCTVDHVIISSWNETPAKNGLTPCVMSQDGFDVVVRDAAGTPVPNAQVRITFGGTGTSIRPYTNLGPGPTFAQCFDFTIVVGPTDGLGRIHFVPHFGRYAETRVVPVFADGVQIALIEARSPDYDGDGDVDLSDLTTFSGDYLDTQNYRARSDFDDCAGSTLGDFVFFVGQYLASGATGVPRPVCN
jgi:hypothetical protein